MKLYIGNNPRHKTEDCVVIEEFNQFVAMSKEDIKLIDEIVMDDFLLSMSCFYYLVDNYGKELTHIKFVILTTDNERVASLRKSIKQYVDKFNRPEYRPLGTDDP